MYVDPWDPHPFNVRTKSFQMEFSLDGTKFLQWVTVKRSLMGANAGCGLFAARTFMVHDIITVYFGTKAKSKTKDNTRCLIVGKKIIDVPPQKAGARPLYFGAHFANTPYWGLEDDQHDLHDKNHWSGRNPNAEIYGVQIVATQRITVGDKIRLDYGHRKQQTKETAPIKKRVKKQERTVFGSLT